MMLIFVALGLIIGRLRGGRLSRYLDQPLRWIALPIFSFALKASLPLWQRLSLSPECWLPALVAAEYGTLLLFCLFNRRRSHSMLLIAFGTLSNFAAHIANGFRMPVLSSILMFPALSKVYEQVSLGLRPEYVLVDTGAPLWFLGDCIPFTILLPGVASVGDLLLGVGVCWLLQRLMGCDPLFPRNSNLE